MAPPDLLGVGDATWMADPERYSVVIMAYGGAVHHETKLIKLVCADSSQENEGLASTKVRQHLVVAREFLRCAGAELDGPSLLLSDNMSNVQIAGGSGSAARARHTLRRYLALQAAVKGGDIILRHIPDGVNPADFLTKWLSGPKLKASLAFVTNAKNRVSP